MKKIFKGLIIFAMTLLIISPITVFAGGLTLEDITGENSGATNIGSETGLAVTDPRDIASNLIGVVLGFLGILAVIIILIGGFKWMTAGGNEDQVAEARKIIVSGVIGLVIVLASWGIANFVLNAILGATS